MQDLKRPECPNLRNADLCLFKHLHSDEDDEREDTAVIDTKLQAMPSLKSFVLSYTGYCVNTNSYKQKIDQGWMATSFYNPHQHGDDDANEDDYGRDP